MDIIFVRHATSEPRREDDRSRELTDKGRTESRATGMALRTLEAEPELILTSPYPRARQTAEELSAVLEDIPVEEVEFLAPARNYRGLCERVRELVGQRASRVVCVGHAPSLDEMVAQLIGGDDDLGLHINKAGAACVRLDEDENIRLHWLLRRKHLALLARLA